MTNTSSTQIGNSWDFGFYQPQPSQDSEILKQLGFIPGFKELLILRQVHALEHATVWILSETGNCLRREEGNNTSQADNEALGGLSTEQGFYLYGQVNRFDLQRAVRLALQRLKGGEWNLAVHPRCGTNLSVAMLLTAGFTLGASLILPRNPLEQVLGLSLAALTATQIAPDLGNSVQRYLTTSIPFNLEVADIAATADIWGRRAHFVRVRWQDLQ